MQQPCNWEAGVQYNVGDKVVYQGYIYEIIQPHRSQIDWTPDQTPALWRKVGRADSCQQDYGGACQQQASAYQPSYNQPPQCNQPQYNQPPQPQYQPQDVKQEPAYVPSPQGQAATAPDTYDDSRPNEEKKDFFKEHKTELVAGGLAAAAALAGGAFLMRDKHKTEEQRQVHSEEQMNWIVAARERSRDFLSGGLRAPTAWVYCDFLSEPQVRHHLVKGGEEYGKPLYIIRAPHKGGLQLGKFSFDNGAFYGFTHDAHPARQFEVLVGDMRALRWVPMNGRFSQERLGARAVEGGQEDDGTRLVIARAYAKQRTGLLGMGGSEEGLYPGKASSKLNGAFVTIGDKEIEVEKYEVLALA